MRAIRGVEVSQAVTIQEVNSNTRRTCGEWQFAPALQLPLEQARDLHERVTIPRPAQESGSEA